MRSVVYPFLNRGDLLRREFPAYRHDRFVETRNHAEKPALFRLAGHKRRPTSTALQRAFARAQVEFGLLRRAAMALPATVLENGADVAREGNRLFTGG